MKVRLFALLIAVGTVVAADGCGDPTAIRAQSENVETPVTVYAFNGTPAPVPTALRVLTATPVRMDGSFQFDLAFDLNAAGEVVVYTVRAVASELAPGHRVGLQATTVPFADVDRAPTSGYAYDSSMVVPVGRTVLIDAVDASGYCSVYSLLGTSIRAKMVVDSVNSSMRAIYLHLLASRTCGFRSLTPGLPKD